MIIGTNNENINEQNIITGRSCIIAQSGAGKSYALAVICEELLNKKLGFTIIDVEGEYFSLKQKFDLLWVGGKNSDINIKDINFKTLAEKVINNNIAVIFDISELDNQKDITEKWLNALYDVEEKIKKPYLIIIEEADKFIPQKRKSSEIITNIARRGRKRGLGLLIASQRPAFINKDILSQCNQQFIGKLIIDADIKSVNYFFNSRSDLKKLPDLMPGEFFMMGFGKDILIKFKKRITNHESTTPEINKALPQDIKKIISELIKKPNIKETITKKMAREIAIKNIRKKYILFGPKEELRNIELILKPVFEFKVSIPIKKFFNNETLSSYIHITPDFVVVNEFFEKLFDLSLLKDLNQDEVKALILMKYENIKTIKDLVKKGYEEKNIRDIIKKLKNKRFILEDGWKGRYKKYKVIKELEIPKVKSLFSNKFDISNETSNKDENNIGHIIKLLNPNTKIISKKLIYFPFYKATLSLRNIYRELWINGLTGELL